MNDNEKSVAMLLDQSPQTAAAGRYDWQGELETELTEKIKFGLDSLATNHRYMFASHMFELISIAVYEREAPINELWELINSRMGQYLAVYYQGDVATLPDHIKTEIMGMREPISAISWK